MTTEPGTPRIRNFVAILMFLAIVGLAYQNSFKGSFHSDDYTTIQSHPEIEHPENFWRFPPHYRQWLTASYALNFVNGGLNPWGYHAVNLALHLFTACLLMALIRLTLMKGWEWSAQNANRVAFTSSLLFALHPVHTETVTYISGRGSGLSSLFYLGALYFFTASQLKQTSTAKRSIAFVLMFLGGIGAVLSKETSLTLPFGLLLFDLYFMRGACWTPRSTRWKMIYGPLALGFTLIFLISPTFSIQATHWLNRIEWSLALDQLSVLAHAFKLVFLPFNLTFDYDFPRTTFLRGSFHTFSIFFWALLLAAAWRFRKQNPPVFTFAVCWFLITLSPTNSVLPRMDLLSERNLYLPSIGLCWWGGQVLNALVDKKAAFRLAPVIAIILLLVTLCYGLLTHNRNGVYATDITLWQDTLKKSPHKSEVHYYLAMAHYLAGDLAGSRREIDRLTKKDPLLVKKITASPEASKRQLESYLQLLETLKQVVQSDPGQYKMYGQVYRELAGLYRNTAPLYFTRLLLGAQLASQGKLNLAEAEFRQALKARPHLPHAHLDLATLFAQRGMLDQALQETDLAKSKSLEAHNLEPRWRFTRARIFLGQKKLEQARQEAILFLKADASNIEGKLLVGDIEMLLGNFDSAITYWQQVEDPPQMKAEALFRIARAYTSQNKIDTAQRLLEESLKLNPNHFAARFSLAHLLVEHGGDLDEARHHYETLLKIAPDPAMKKTTQRFMSRIPKK